VFFFFVVIKDSRPQLLSFTYYHNFHFTHPHFDTSHLIQQGSQQLAAMSKVQVKVFLHSFFVCHLSMPAKENSNYSCGSNEIYTKSFNNFNFITKVFTEKLLLKHVASRVHCNERYTGVATEMRQM
jgi:hypothetical protein